MCREILAALSEFGFSLKSSLINILPHHKLQYSSGEVEKIMEALRVIYANLTRSPLI